MKPIKNQFVCIQNNSIMGVVGTVKFHDKTRMIWLLSSPSPLSKTSEWIDKHRTFTFEHYFKNKYSIKMKLRLFRMHFNIHLNQLLPNRFTTYQYTECFRERSSLKRRAWPGRLISIRWDVPWPARSLDTAPCDFFLCDYWSQKFFKKSHQQFRT